MVFPSLDALINHLREIGAKHIYCKQLAENDNTKQQIYFGGSFEILKQLPFMNIREESGGKRPNFKASLNMAWINAEGYISTAPGAQLILYPDYPEVRLSGFLRGCPLAPSNLMQPVPSAERKFNNGPDGRVLFLGITETGQIYAYLSSAGSTVSSDFSNQLSSGSMTKSGVFWLIPPPAEKNSREKLLSALRVIHLSGWHESRRLNKLGQEIPYIAQNGGGYTLEALLGIIPNGLAEPDYLGWEVKGYGSGKVTLMTPEPDMGFYGTQGAEAFVRKYGRDTGEDTLYFTGIHRSNQLCAASQQTLKLEGFSVTHAGTGKITDVSGGIVLIDSKGEITAGWSFPRLMEHWGRKHAAAAYVPYSKQPETPPLYKYNSPVLLGEETAFELFLGALHAGHVVYDPAPKVTNASTPNSRVKARNQFRVPIRNLPCLYRRFSSVNLDSL